MTTHSARPVSVCLMIVFSLLLTGCLGDEDFSPEDLKSAELMVATTMPGSGELELGRSLGLRLAAGSAVNWDTLGVDPDDAARIEPTLDGRWGWGRRGTLEFYPDEPYLPNTRYKVQVQADAFAAKGWRLRGRSKFDFTVTPFAVSRISLDRERVGDVPARHRVTGLIEFNFPVDPEAVRERLQVVLDGFGELEFMLESAAAARTIGFRTAEFVGDEQDRQLTVKLKRGLKPVTGNVAIGTDEEKSMTIPALERLTIHDLAAESDGLDSLLFLRFSETVLPETLEKHLTIEPEVPNLRLSGNWMGVRLHGDFKPQKKYTVTIDENLSSEKGLLLEKGFTRTIKIDDLEPVVRITGPGNYLSLRGEGKLAVETVNLSGFDLEVQRIYPNNLVPFLQKVSLRHHQDYYYAWSLEDHGTRLYQREFQVDAGPTNSLQITPVDLGPILDEESRGIFRIQVMNPEGGNQSDGRWLVATDLGLVVKSTADRMDVAVASINKLAPVGGVKIRVLSHNNQELAIGRTNAQGMVAFDGLGSADYGNRPFVVVATKGDDLSFLALDETRIRTADLDVGGIVVAEKGYRAFLYGDRDIYRPGESVPMVWMVRDNDLRPVTGFPLNLKIFGPGGDEFIALRTQADEAGCGEYTVEIPTWARTGRYTALLMLGEDKTLGEHSFSVEDFMPDRMKVTAELVGADGDHAVLRPNATVQLKARAMSLFGPPAADRQADVALWYRRTPIVMAGYEDFTFGLNKNEIVPPRRNLGHVKTDDQGHASWELTLPETPDFQGWLRLSAQVSVTELGGGRAVKSTVEANYSPVDRVIGLRNLDPDGSDYRVAGEPVHFEAVMLDLGGKLLADPKTRMKLLRRNWRTVLRKGDDGEYRYISEYDEVLVQEKEVALGAAKTALEVTPSTHGSYRLVLESGDAKIRGAIDFYVYGFGYSPWAMSNPERINLKLDRDSYRGGDVVTASVEAPFPGLMLVTVEREKVYHRQWVRLEENTGTVKVRLPHNLDPNVYLTATLLRSVAELDPRSPARAFGAEPVFLSQDNRILPVEIQAATEMRPRAPLTVRVKMPAGSDPMRLTVAAVDEGILQLTGFDTPSALDFFMQRRRLAVQSHDIWSLLLPEFERAKRQSKTGGGMERAMLQDMALAKRLNPLASERVKPVALWSGLLEGREGWQDITLDVPEFNGSLRVMVTATAGDRFGKAETQVRVADPLVLSPSLPRFLAPGDRFRVPVPVYNALPDGSSGSSSAQVAVEAQVAAETQVAAEAQVAVEVLPTGPLALVAGTPVRQEMVIAQGKEEVAWFEMEAASKVGVAEVKIQATGGGEKASVTTELPVRPPHALESSVTSGSIDGAVVEVPLRADWLPGSTVTTISVAAHPAAAFGAALPYLLRYPYGCLEQKISRCFPLIYFGPLAATLAPGEFGENDGDYFIHGGLDYLVTLYRRGVGFVMWPGSGYETFNPFANVYAVHFLVEAHQAGYALPEKWLDDALDLIGELARSGRDGWPSSWRPSLRENTRAYACYVLARAGRPERGAMDQLVKDRWEQLSVAARTHLAGAYALIGNRPRFDELLPAADAPVESGRSTGFTWHSLARDEAMRLEVLATVDPDHIQVPRLMRRLSARAENGRWYNTQENAFALLALGKLASGNRLAPATGTVKVGDDLIGIFDGEDFSIQGRDWAGQKVQIQTEAGGHAWYSILDEGVPVEAPATPQDNGLVIRRQYLDRDGNPIDLEAIEQGQTVVCRLLLKSEKGTVNDVVISDLVPAGLEIENPRLSENGPFGAGLYDHPRMVLDHWEVRDDRLLLFTRAQSSVKEFQYLLRAVTAGEFVLPPVRAEAMYDPEVMSTRNGGEVRIVTP